MKYKKNDVLIKTSGYLFISILFHLFFLWNLSEASRVPAAPEEKIFVTILPVEVPAPIPPKPKAPPKIPKKTAHRVATQQHTKQAKPHTQPVQGLSKDSFVKDGTPTVQAPVGNTLLTGDEGIRKSSVGDLQGDLSQRARRISLVKPEYTEAALQAGLEGQFVADVYIDEKGQVGEVSLQKKAGYGMDAKLLHAAKNARYEPRKDAMGRSIGGWDRIVFQLVLP